MRHGVTNTQRTASLKGVFFLLGVVSILSLVLPSAAYADGFSSAPEQQGWTFMAVCLVFYVGCVIWSLVGLLVFRKRPAAKAQDWPALLEADLHPALLSWLWRKNSGDDRSIAATLLRLTEKGAIELVEEPAGERCVKAGFAGERPASEEPAGAEPAGEEPADVALAAEGAAGERSVGKRLAAAEEPAGVEPSGYVIRRLSGWEKKVSGDPLDEHLIRLLFEKAGEGSNAVPLGILHSYATLQKKEYKKETNAWSDHVRDEALKNDLVNKRVLAWVKGFPLAWLALLVTAFLGYSMTESFVMPIAAIVSAASMLACVAGADASTERSSELKSMMESLHAWMTRPGSLGEDALGSVSDWRTLAVYACVFGVHGEFGNALRAHVPSMEEESRLQSVLSWFGPQVGAQLRDELAGDAPLDMLIDSELQANSIASETSDSDSYFDYVDADVND